MNRVLEAVQIGTVLYDSAAVPDCLAALEAAACHELTLVAPDACEQAVAGTVALGGPCELDEECVGVDTYCRIDASCPGSCESRLAAGGACRANQECQAGLMCFAGQCVVPPGSGAPCLGGIAPDCPLGMACVGDAPGQTGTCADSANVFTQMTEASCSLDNDQLCVLGAYCAATAVTQDAITLTCKTGAASGAPCHYALPDMCPDGEYCSVRIADLQGGIVDGSCIPLPGEGQPCTDAFAKACALESICLDGVCRALQRLGAGCVSPVACYSGNCASGVCAVPDPCPG